MKRRKLSFVFCLFTTLISLYVAKNIYASEVTSSSEPPHEIQYDGDTYHLLYNETEGVSQKIDFSTYQVTDAPSHIATAPKTVYVEEIWQDGKWVENYQSVLDWTELKYQHECKQSSMISKEIIHYNPDGSYHSKSYHLNYSYYTK